MNSAKNQNPTIRKDNNSRNEYTNDMMELTTSGIYFKDTKLAEGAIIEQFTWVRVKHWLALSMEDLASECWLDTFENHAPIITHIGEGTLLQGIEEGIRGMRIGSTRRMIIPPHLAYGKRGVPSLIPPNTTLYVDVNISTKKPRK